MTDKSKEVVFEANSIELGKEPDSAPLDFMEKHYQGDVPDSAVEANLALYFSWPQASTPRK